MRSSVRRQSRLRFDSRIKENKFLNKDFKDRLRLNQNMKELFINTKARFEVMKKYIELYEYRILQQQRMGAMQR